LETKRKINKRKINIDLTKWPSYVMIHRANGHYKRINKKGHEISIRQWRKAKIKDRGHNRSFRHNLLT